MRVGAGCFAVFLAGIVSAYAGDTASAVAALNAAAKAQVKWDVAKAQTADVNCDGVADTILFGTTKGKVWVGIVPGGGGQPMPLDFAVKGHPPNSFKLYPLDCKTDEGIALDGCRTIPGCKGFSIELEFDTDPFNFYWNDDGKAWSYWRN
jgi:hypothetical protein